MALRIKSNIDLKELKKFGFIKVKKGKTGFTDIVNYWYSKEGSEYDCITIFKDRTVYIGLDTTGDSYIYDKLYDLIKADLVEKVSDDNE